MLISFVWLPGTIGWDIVVPILFFLITRVRYNRLHSPSIICPENMWELEKATREHESEESRAIVPSHVEHDETGAEDKNETP